MPLSLDRRTISETRFQRCSWVILVWLGGKASRCALWVTTDRDTSGFSSPPPTPQPPLPRDFLQGQLEEGGTWKLLVTRALQRILGTCNKDVWKLWLSWQAHSLLAICKSCLGRMVAWSFSLTIRASLEVEVSSLEATFAPAALAVVIDSNVEYLSLHT